ncbi:MAG: hypothetical protein IIZ25_12850 [Thermoguttaceae bacterium]|nr:hypothetical protein [Thermoguttaceae bacterium]
MLLPQEEYVEQHFFFKTFAERLDDGYSSQEILRAMKSELLSTVHLPMAVDFLLAEVKLNGVMNQAMARMPHYFTPFQTFVVSEAEREGGRFDFRTALVVLERLAGYMAGEHSVQGIFFFQFETMSRNRLGYDQGLKAISLDPVYDENWRRWVDVILRRQVGIIDLADLIYVRSSYYERKPGESDEPVLFGDREGRIAWASRKRDPSFLFSALSRHLAYPKVPRAKKIKEEENLIPVLKRRIELLESRLQILEEELRGGIQLERFYKKND